MVVKSIVDLRSRTQATNAGWPQAAIHTTLVLAQPAGMKLPLARSEHVRGQAGRGNAHGLRLVNGRCRPALAQLIEHGEHILGQVDQFYGHAGHAPLVQVGLARPQHLPKHSPLLPL